MKTVLFALALALAMPIGAQTLDYATLCGDATEGTGDNNDFCHLWAQNNWQGMRNALSISIRTARAAENRNRFYFDHKRGAERGAFIQLKRIWMPDDWIVRREERYVPHDLSEYGGGPLVGRRVIWFDIGGFRMFLEETGYTVYGKDPREYGFAHVELWRETGQGASGRSDLLTASDSVDGAFTSMPAEHVKRFVECWLDEFGWQMNLNVGTRPSVDDSRDCRGMAVR